jgi:UDP-N-acetylglucosamine diphosphorylase / glucose-1-phosphate thymidylyltransferase / UDP-N-acetylgalactosamine diphosphorylase / glucosamine-1-phosphate N-acetyltransferase / galactosamine-1-phosphate N-acetyltransferase
MLRPEDFFDLEGFKFRGLFDGSQYVWEALSRVGRFALEYIMNLDGDENILGVVMSGAHIDDRNAVVIGKGTVVEPGAFIQGPAIIGENCQIRHGAYIRGDVVIGNNCTVGHTSELKNAIMLDTAQCPHFAYVGDSILGRKVNLGAGTKLSNLPVVSIKDGDSGKRPTIKIEIDGKCYDTGLSKFGAVVGDGVQTGCNTVTNPGCLIGKNTLTYPNISLRKGYYPPNQIIKLHQELVSVAREEKG